MVGRLLRHHLILLEKMLKSFANETSRLATLYVIKQTESMEMSLNEEGQDVLALIMIDEFKRLLKLQKGVYDDVFTEIKNKLQSEEIDLIEFSEYQSSDLKKGIREQSDIKLIKAVSSTFAVSRTADLGLVKMPKVN